MAFNLTGEEFEAIKQAFLSVDKDGNGVITEKELVDAALEQIEDCTEEDCQAIKSMCDLDGDGTINFCEFLEMMAQFQYSKEHSEVGLKSMFQAFDKNGDGVLTKDEIARAWKMFINPNAEEADKEITECMAKCDLDGDGKISYDEFVKGVLTAKEYKTEEVAAEY